MELTSPLFCDYCGAANRTRASFCRACGRSLGAPVMANTTINTTIVTSNTLTGLLSQQHVLKQRYVILGPAGRGGFGAVYKASDTAFGNRLVAIKEMSQSTLKPEELQNATESFKNEALLLASLTHPNLPRIYEQFPDTGRSYLVMDFIEGETLADLLSKPGAGQMPVDKVLDIALQLCSVLEYLHTRQPPVIFRDLKPGNVMLTPGGHIYLIDFGIARHFKPGKAKDTTALGSSGYAPPEQYGRSQTTARADIYSLGATLHQLLTGDDPSERPFHFASFRLPHPELSGLDTLVMNMVTVDINKRPATITVVKRQLQTISTRYTSTQPLHPSSVPGSYQMPPLPEKKSAKLSRRSSQLQVRPQLNMLYVCYGHTSRITCASWSPDGKKIATASFDKTVQIWDAITGKNLLTYKGHYDRVNSLSWSPDGKKIATASEDSTVRVWDTTTLQTLYTCSAHSGIIYSVVWSPDGQSIASAGSDKKVQIWSPVTGEISFTYQGHRNAVHAVAWSPDGKQLASGGADNRVHLWVPLKDQPKRTIFAVFSSLLNAQNAPQHLRAHTKRINSISWTNDGKFLASASSDQTVQVYNTLTGSITTIEESRGTGMKNAVAWSPTGKHLAIAGNNKAVEVWNVQANKAALNYLGHVNYVMTVAWSPDGTRIASAGVDRTLQVWQAS